MRFIPSRGSGWTSYPQMLLRTPGEAWAGLRYGYPLCCVAHYCLDNLLYRLSAQRRGSVVKHKLNDLNDDGRYVPCFRCKRNAIREGTWRAPRTKTRTEDIPELTTCSCGFCKFEERTSPAEQRAFGEFFMELARENEWSLPFSMSEDTWSQFTDEVVAKFERREAVKAD